jgi:hypothetical protein
MIPAVVIEKIDSWKEMKDKFNKIQENVPAVLVGVLGIDFGASAF